MTKVTIVAAGRPALSIKLPLTIDFADAKPEDVTVGEVKQEIAAQCPKFNTSRQKLSVKGDKKPLADDDTLAKASVADGVELTIKDLGPQIGWKTVFLVEYAGPLVIHPIFFFFPKYIYGGDVQHSILQKYAFAMVMLHFIKREAETLFIHRFSHSTMPLSNLFKNSAHYHILSGALLAFALYRPKYAAFSPTILGTKYDSLLYLWFWTVIFLFAELSNFKTHLITSSLRPAGSRKRAIPYGYGFNLVSFPNYFFESMAWFALACMTGSRAAWLFFIVGTTQMVIWAVKKHKAYKKEFGSDYPKNRRIIFPFIF